MAAHVRAMLAFSKIGVPTFDYGNNIRQMAKEMKWKTPLIFRFVPAYIRPALFCRHRAVSLVALSGDPRISIKPMPKSRDSG